MTHIIQERNIDTRADSKTSQKTTGMNRYGQDSISISNPTDPLEFITTEKYIAGYSGGEICISGVSLKIPPHSLEKDHLIEVGTVINRDLFPKMEKEEFLLTPVVYCGPHGVTFKDCAILTIPHCAGNIHEWRLKILKNKAENKNSVHWEGVHSSQDEVVSFISHTIFCSTWIRGIFFISYVEIIFS